MIWGLTWRFSQELRKKNKKKLFFYLGENLKSDPTNFSDRVNFQMKPFKMVKIISDNVRRRYVMPTYSVDNPKSKICSYNLALPCPSQKRKYKTIEKKSKKKASAGAWTHDLLHGSLLPYQFSHDCNLQISALLYVINTCHSIRF